MASGRMHDACMSSYDSLFPKSLRPTAHMAVVRCDSRTNGRRHNACRDRPRSQVLIISFFLVSVLWSVPTCDPQPAQPHACSAWHASLWHSQPL